jgi:arylsulfatase A-like enzyme
MSARRDGGGESGGYPNVLIIYSDQLRADSLSCAGNEVVKTPHIDRLANEGARFSNAFVSYPLCGPFRASLFTGKYAHAHGVYANHYAIPLGQDFLAEIYHSAGYATGYFGKWHLNGGQVPGFVPPGKRRLGFEHFIGFNRGHHYFNSIYYKDRAQPFTSRRYEPDYQTDQLIEFMDECKKEQTPYLAVINYGLPHPPFVGPDHYLNLYKPESVKLRANTPEDQGAQEKACQFLAKYYGLIACLDHNVGKVLDWLDASGLVENTIVIFLSDHGEMAGEHDRYAKTTYFRGAMQVPLIVRYPRTSTGGIVVDDLVDLSVDTMPTLLELCKLQVPEAVQGRSYLDALIDAHRRSERDFVFYQILRQSYGPEKFPVAERGLRTKNWLYVRNKEHSIALFNLDKDPNEVNDLSALPQYVGIIKDMDARLKKLMIEINDDWEIEADQLPDDFDSYQQGDINVEVLGRRAMVEA